MSRREWPTRRSLPTTMEDFAIPSSIQDLERVPYNLLPYPDDFCDDDEAARALSFERLVQELEQGNQVLVNSDITLFEQSDDVWMNEERIQSLYTLVRYVLNNLFLQALTNIARRKSTSLASDTRISLVNALVTSLQCLATMLEKAKDTVPSSFRSAWACHLYMLYTFLVFFEGEQKGHKLTDDLVGMRRSVADTFLIAAATMHKHRNNLWPRGVADEAVVVLPIRVAYGWLEISTGVLSRKTGCGDQALKILAETIDGCDGSSILTMITAALMDLMHSFEHVAGLVAELCEMVREDPVNRLAIELLREISRLEGNGSTGSGIKHVAPFLCRLAAVRPKLVWQHLSQLTPQLSAEPYNLRSSIVTAISHIAAWLHKQMQAEMSSDSIKSMASAQKQLLDLLATRVHDVSSYTRSTVMKAWISLVENECLPKDRFLSVTNLAMDRLKDKTVMVRKQSMQLLSSLLEHNPFMGNLDPVPFRRKFEELRLFVKGHLPENIKEAHEAALEDAKDDSKSQIELEQAAVSTAMNEADAMLEAPDDLTPDQKEFCTKVQALHFTMNALEFIDVFEDAASALDSMLLSANTSDVTEALRLLVKARHFGLPCAVSGMKRALALMWSSETAVRDEVLKAFVQVFIEKPGSEEKLPNAQIAQNLLALVDQASVSEVASIEEAIVRLVREEGLPADVFLILWSLTSNDSGRVRSSAVQLLAMGAKADRSIVDSKSRLKLLLESALGDYAEDKKDWKLMCSAAVALQRVSRAEVDPSDAKFLVLERLMEQLCVVAQGDWCDDQSAKDTLGWFSAAENAIEALFVLCPEPETACRSILTTMQQTTFQSSPCHSLLLARFFHVVGAVALNLLVYSEELSGSVRRANAQRTLKRQEQADEAKRNKSEAAIDEEDSMEAELGMAQEAEAENERKVADIADNEILGRGLLGAFVPLLVRVVKNGGIFESDLLMQSSVLALCKCMCVSRNFCERHLPLLFTALTNAPKEDTILRANTVVALGDLAFRFPNEVEPYTPRLYACLRDSSMKVRRHTLMVLTHLILNDMVKVKGQVCEIALCLRDNDPRIRDMTRLLFHELSKRSNNPVYNLLPDITSQLSQQNLRREDFRGIMSFLLGFIKKDKQNEMLTDKLCQRFPKSETSAQKADLAYCLALLKMNERAIKFLSDNLKLYKDALADDDVKKSFLSIIVKAKKSMKPEMKQFIEEWEAKVNESADVGAENEQADKSAEKAKAKAKRRQNRKKPKQPLQTVQDEGGEFEFDEGDE